jgi:hypothetical protein
MKIEELHRQAESRRLEFKESFGRDLLKGGYIVLHRNKMLAEAFYLSPALARGLIEMTIPDKPNSKHQKYRLTEKGKRMKKNNEIANINNS